MKGLIIKEFYGEVKGMLIIHLVWAILTLTLSFTPVTQNILFLFWLSISLVILYPAFSLTKDFEKGFHICSETLPVSKAEIIISKFKVSWILAVFPAVITFVAMIIHLSIYGGENFAEELRCDLFILAVGVVFSSLFQIFMIKKAKPGNLLAGLYGGMGYAVSTTAYEIFPMFENQSLILLIFGILAVVSYVFSYFKCIDIYKKGVIR